MSLDPSLKSASSLVRHRNVLTRAERLGRLRDEEKWTDAKSVFGLPKVANRKLELAKTEKEAAPAEGAAATAAAPAAAAGKGGAGSKGAAPAAPAAKGAAAPAAAKAAAPAAKKK